MHRLHRLLLPLVLVVVAFSGTVVPARAAVPDVWVKWNLGDVWIRSLDYVTPTQLVAASEDSGVFTAASAAGPWTDISGNLSTLAKQVRQAVGQSGQIYLATSAGLFKGSGNGSWTKLGVADATPASQRLDQGGVQSVIFPTGQATSMVAATAGSGRDGVFWSTDSGVRWTRATGLTSATFSITGNASALYAAASTGFYKSTDDGRTWVLKADGIPPGETPKRIVVSDLNPLQLVAATVGGVYRSDNGGTTWYAANGSGEGFLNASEVRAFQLVPSAFWADGEPRMVVGTNNGVWATTDGGASWSKMAGAKSAAGEVAMSSESVYSLAIGFGTPGSLIAGTQGHGLFTLPLQAVEAPASIPAPSGSPVQNAVLTASTGTWAGTLPLVFAYQWKRCNSSSGMDASGATCTAINGATGRTHQVAFGDVGKHLRVGVRALNLVQPLFSAEKLSASVGPVAAPAGFEPMPPSGFPQLGGGTSAPWGQTMSIATGGNWKSNGTTTATTFAYRWYRCELDLNGCVPLPTTAASYTTTTDDVERVVKATVVGTIAGTSSPERLAGFSGAVYEQTPQVLAPPRVVGPAHVGTKLQSTAGAWTGNNPTFTRRWLRCNASGVQCAVTSPVATGPTYTVRTVDRGFTFRVEVTATVVDQFQARTAKAESTRSVVAANPPPTCAQLKSAITKAQQAVTAAQKALKKAQSTGDRARIRKAEKRLDAARTVLKKAKARFVAAGC